MAAPAGEPSRVAVDRLLAAAGGAPAMPWEFEGRHAILSLVSRGIGVAAVPRLALAAGEGRVVVRDLPGSDAARDVRRGGPDGRASAAPRWRSSWPPCTTGPGTSPPAAPSPAPVPHPRPPPPTSPRKLPIMGTDYPGDWRARGPRRRHRGHLRGQATISRPLQEESATMTRAVHVPYTVEQDEDGIWCAHAQLRPGVGGTAKAIQPRLRLRTCARHSKAW